jgi:hypothetical protein
MSYLSTHKKFLRGVLLLKAGVFAVVLLPPAAQACSSCGCTLNADWSSQGYAVSSGVRLDLRQDYYDQTQLRDATHGVTRSSVAIPNAQEVQQRTLNRNTVVGLEYDPSRLWGMRVEVPYYNRFHSTIAEGDEDISTAHSRSMGDVRMLARYQGFSADLSWGVQAGLKLPTGANDVLFKSGPQAGEQLDRGLQPGSGSSDLLLGGYHFGNFSARLGYYAQAMWQQPINSDDGFKPGAGVNLSAGLRYSRTSTIVPQIQLNLRYEGRETGANADHGNSGATLLYVSPGANLKFNSHLNAFAFLQLPVYQRVNGLQLLPSRFFSVGMQYSF